MDPDAINEVMLRRESAELSNVAAGRKTTRKNGAGDRADSASANSPVSQFSLRLLRAKAEIDAISQALERTGWNRRRAADLLCISYRGLAYKIRQYDITAREPHRS